MSATGTAAAISVSSSRRDAADEAMAPIAFDRRKYGCSLLVDAGQIGKLPNFITAPRPHRLGFYEIALVTHGRGALDIDGVSTEVAPFRVFCTRAGEIRRWRVAGGLDGRVVFFEREFVDDFLPDSGFLAESPLFCADSRKGAIVIDRRAFDRLDAIACDMLDEISALRDDSAHMLRAHTYRLLVELRRHQPRRGGDPPDGRRAIHRRFVALVDANFLHLPHVAQYADLLRISPGHLNERVRRASGVTASAVIHRRQFAEARRLLLFTDLTVEAIAARLAFSDAPYFNRFFKRMAGTTPGAFRAAEMSNRGRGK
jgi:AraC family transcriptional activator of pobA